MADVQRTGNIGRDNSIAPGQRTGKDKSTVPGGKVHTCDDVNTMQYSKKAVVYDNVGIRPDSVQSLTDVVYPPSFCPDGSPHFYVEITRSVWWCKKCWASKWLPGNINDALAFGLAVRSFGLDKAYSHALGDLPNIRSLLAELDRIKNARKHMPNHEKELREFIEYIVTHRSNNIKGVIKLCKIQVEVEFMMLQEGQ